MKYTNKKHQAKYNIKVNLFVCTP